MPILRPFTSCSPIKFLQALLVIVGLLGNCPGQSSAIAQPQRVEWLLPQQIYAVAGLPLNVYFANAIRTQSLANVQVQVECPLGQSQPTFWTLNPQDEDVGEHPLQLEVKDAQGNTLAQATTTLLVAPQNAGESTPLRLLLVGDSLTHASIYPNELSVLLNIPSNPALVMLGTHRPERAAPEVAHEGYGGWTWQRFAEHYEPQPDGTYKKKSSPFVSLNAGGKPALDVPRYFREHCGRPISSSRHF